MVWWPSEYNFNVREDFRGEGPKSQKGNEEAEKEEVAISAQLSAFSFGRYRILLIADR
jgi:hypothetical protein